MRKMRSDLTAKEREKYFLSLFIRHGAREEKVAYCEKRAALRAGKGKKILKRRAVQLEIKARLAPVASEQYHQAIVSEAVDAAMLRIQEGLATEAKRLEPSQIDDVIKGRLMEMVIWLDMNRSPKELLKAIKLALVVHGSLQIGNIRRANPAQRPAAENQECMGITELSD